MRLIGTAIFLACAVLLGLPATATAMGWYDAMCCSNRDCRPIMAGEVELHADGWYVVPADRTVPFGDWKIKPSKDVRIHICMTNHGANGSPNVVCLYIPDPGT